jgi:MFS family permease
MAAPPESSSAPATPSPLAIPIFRAVWIASMASNFGGLIQSVGAAWSMVRLSGSPQLIALVPVSISLPILLFALLAGAIADNLDRRKVMIAAQSFMLLVSLGLSICSWAGVLSPWLLLGFTFLIGTGMALNGPAWQASVGDMVPRPALRSAVALNSMGFNVARSVGPAIGGVIVAAWGASAAFAINAVSYLGLIAVLLRWRPVREVRTLPREPMGAAMAAGVRYVAMSPHLTTALVRTALFGSAASAIPALNPLIARDMVGGGAVTFGILLGAFGTGAVLGAGASGRLRSAWSNEAIVRMTAVAQVLATLVTALSHSLLLTAPALMLAGASWLLSLTTFNATVQLASPRWIVARALSLYQMSAFGGLAVGSWLFGLAAEYEGVRGALFVAAAWQVASGLLALRWPLAKVDDLNLDPTTNWREPETAVPVEPRSGPVVIMIEYRIAAGDVAAFLAEMSERRRVRRRDGAYDWTLLRDLGEADLWIERYRVPTWVDYVRHNQRRTHADSANFERILALHRGPGGPRIHRLLESHPGSPRRAPGPQEMADPVADPA